MFSILIYKNKLYFLLRHIIQMFVKYQKIQNKEVADYKKISSTDLNI